MDIWGIITNIFTTLATVVVVASPFFKWIRKFTRSWELFMRDWSGEAARPGHDKEPGVMERLNNLDGQFKNNGGGSLKDAVDRIEQKLADIDDRLEEGNRRFDNIEKEMKHHV